MTIGSVTGPPVEGVIESTLACNQPFGDHAYIWERLRVQYRRRLEILAEFSKQARDLLSVFDDIDTDRYRLVLGDPVVRLAVDRAVCYIKVGGVPFPEAELQAALIAGLSNLRNGSPVSPLAKGSLDRLPIYNRGPCPWVWSEDRAAHDPLGDIFRRLMKQHHEGLQVVTPDLRVREMLVAGATLLHALCPRLAASAMSHVHLVAVVDANSPVRINSMTNPRIPGVFFLSPAVLTSPWQAAEYLLHEAMHLKFLDLENTHSLFSESYDETRSPLIRPHWNKVRQGNEGEWPINRVLTVTHVYTCLALFFSIVAKRSPNLEGEYGPLHRDPIRQLRRSFDRAHYLRYQLSCHEEQLGVAGRLMVRWLGEILMVFDTAAPPEGSYAHLLLDLYEREVDEIRTIAESTDMAVRHDAQLGQAIRKVAMEEISGALEVTSMISAAPPADRVLQNHQEALRALEVVNAGFKDSVDALVAVRSSILQNLSEIPPVAYFLPRSNLRPNTPSEVLRDMVEGSTSQLNSVIKSARARAST